MQMIFGLDHETPINRRIEYGHSFFFDFSRQSKFFLSVWNYMMTKGMGKATSKQIEAVLKIIRENYHEMVCSFEKNIGAPLVLACAGYGRPEAGNVGGKYYDGHGNRMPLSEVSE